MMQKIIDQINELHDLPDKGTLWRHRECGSIGVVVGVRPGYYPVVEVAPGRFLSPVMIHADEFELLYERVD
jgi:hypothetical protein